MKIAVAGTGYVGLSMAVLLAQHHQVVAVDIVPEKVTLINERKSPLQDDYIEKYDFYNTGGILLFRGKMVHILPSGGTICSGVYGDYRDRLGGSADFACPQLADVFCSIRYYCCPGPWRQHDDCVE